VPSLVLHCTPCWHACDLTANAVSLKLTAVLALLPDCSSSLMASCTKRHKRKCSRQAYFSDDKSLFSTMSQQLLQVPLSCGFAWSVGTLHTQGGTGTDHGDSAQRSASLFTHGSAGNDNCICRRAKGHRHHGFVPVMLAPVCRCVRATWCNKLWKATTVASCAMDKQVETAAICGCAAECNSENGGILAPALKQS
jgi:hypothetical protein